MDKLAGGQDTMVMKCHCQVFSKWIPLWPPQAVHKQPCHKDCVLKNSDLETIAVHYSTNLNTVYATQ